MLGKLKAMHPRDFENMSYDLLMLSGMRNLAWRTPGADGGRDLEGIFLRTDFAGGVVVEKWYFECKRYATALAWPTVFEKISYATNQGADYLLFITTSSFSPQCLDEVSNWNATRQRPLVRDWPGHYLSELLGLHPKILPKYGLVKLPQAAAPSIIQLSTELAKAVQASYASQAFGKAPVASTEFAATLADLLAASVEDLEVRGQFLHRPFRNAAEDGFDWLEIEGDATLPFERLAMRALLAAIHLSDSSEQLTISSAGSHFILKSKAGTPISLPASLDKVLHEICFWGSMEINREDGRVILRERRHGGER